MNGTNDRVNVIAKIFKRTMRTQKWSHVLLICTVSLFCALLLVACNGEGTELPTAPPPNYNPIASGNWRLEQTLRSSPDSCLKSPAKMQVYEMAVQRGRNSTVSFVYDVNDFNDQWVYHGTVTGKDFTAHQNFRFGLGCSPAMVGTVSGRFSEDERHLTATEIWTDPENDKKYYSFDWVATQQ